MKTIGVIHEDGAKGIMEVGVPMGIIAALPTKASMVFLLPHI